MSVFRGRKLGWVEVEQLHCAHGDGRDDEGIAFGRGSARGTLFSLQLAKT
jgi:hypothetical protein